MTSHYDLYRAVGLSMSAWETVSLQFLGTPSMLAVAVPH